VTELRLLSWNVAGRVTRLPEQTAIVVNAKADVVCLQEVTPTTAPAWRDALRRSGLGDVRSSLDDWIPGEPPPQERRLVVLTAARWPLAELSVAHASWRS
jgi:endonuclease/exonuclease/phosphatase family metal-dependent hydrolase